MTDPLWLRRTAGLSLLLGSLSLGCSDSRSDVVNARMTCELSFEVCVASQGEGQRCTTQRVTQTLEECETLGSASDVAAPGAAANAAAADFCAEQLARCATDCSETTDDEECTADCAIVQASAEATTDKHACPRDTGAVSPSPGGQSPGAGVITPGRDDPAIEDGPVVFGSGEYRVHRWIVTPGGTLQSIELDLRAAAVAGMGAKEVINWGRADEDIVYAYDDASTSNVGLPYEMVDFAGGVALFALVDPFAAVVADESRLARLDLRRDATTTYVATQLDSQPFSPGAPRRLAADWEQADVAVGFQGGYTTAGGAVVVDRIPGELVGLATARCRTGCEESWCAERCSDSSDAITFALFNDSEGAKAYSSLSNDPRVPFATSNDAGYETGGDAFSIAADDTQVVIAFENEGTCVLHTFATPSLTSRTVTGLIERTCPTAMVVSPGQLFVAGEGYILAMRKVNDQWELAPADNPALGSSEGNFAGTAVQVVYPLWLGESASLDPFIHVLSRE